MIERPVHRKRSLISSDELPTSSREVWLIPLLLIAQALFVGTTFRTLSGTLVGAVLAILGVAVVAQLLGSDESPQPERSGDESSREKIKPSRTRERTGNRKPNRSTRLRLRTRLALPVAILVALVGAAFRAAHHLIGNLNPVAMIVDMTAHAAFWLSIGLFVFLPRRGHPVMLAAGLILVLMTVSAGGVSHSINGQLVAALAAVIGFALATDHILRTWQISQSVKLRGRRRKRRLQSVATALGSKYLARRPEQDRLPASTVSIEGGQSRSPILFSVLALSVLLMSTSAVGHVAAKIVPRLQLEFFDRLSQSLESVTSGSMIGGSRYVRGSRLGQIRRHMLGDPVQPAVRVFADSSPGYLRGTIFDSYRDASWSIVSTKEFPPSTDTESFRQRVVVPAMKGTTEIEGPASDGLSRFPIYQSERGPLLGTVEIHNVPHKGQLIFSTLSTEWMEAASYRVNLNHHSMVCDGVDTTEPYVLGIASQPPTETLDGLRKEILLEVPLAIRQAIGDLVDGVCDGRLTAKSKARAIEDYFSNGYVYSLREPPTHGDDDPIVHFLQTQHPAHCEFFATATAMMLRIAGVPTRYVTGYVANEMNDGEDYWVARNRDAHAWVEAYDEITERWFPVEATVGRTYLSYLSTEQDIINVAGISEGFLDGDDDRSLLARLLGWLSTFRATNSLTFVFRIAQLPLFCLVIGLLWVRQRQKKRAGEDPVEVQARQMLLRVDRRVKKHALVRSPGETLHQFADRLQSSADDQDESNRFLQTAAKWYREFAAARYQGRPPQPLEQA